MNWYLLNHGLSVSIISEFTSWSRYFDRIPNLWIEFRCFEIFQKILWEIPSIVTLNLHLGNLERLLLCILWPTNQMIPFDIEIGDEIEILTVLFMRETGVYFLWTSSLGWSFLARSALWQNENDIINKKFTKWEHVVLSLSQESHQVLVI